MWLLPFLSAAIFLIWSLDSKTPEPPDSSQKQTALTRYRQAPLFFEANRGQIQNGFDFLARGQGYALLIGSQGAVMKLKTRMRESEMVRFELQGADPNATPLTLEPLEGKVNYFIGKDSKNWALRVPTSATIKYTGVLPGIDILYYGNQGQLEYDFVLAPHSDPSLLRWKIAGAKKIFINEAGELVLELSSGRLAMQKPYAYQQFDGLKRPVDASYRLNNGHVEFALSNYDRSKELVIDPKIVFSTYFGGSYKDMVNGIAVDKNGDIYITGETFSTDLASPSPLVSGIHAEDGIGGDTNSDIFVAKLRYSGNAAYSSNNAIISGTTILSGSTTLLFCSYLGGNDYESGVAIAADSSSNAYITGVTQSTNFPALSGTFLGTDRSPGESQAFMAKFDSSGQLMPKNSWIFGGNQADFGTSIAVDVSGGNVYVAGQTSSSDFPTTANALQSSFKAETDAFVIRFSQATAVSSVVFSTLYGGNGDDCAQGVAVDPAGNVYIAGYTASTNLPLAPASSSIQSSNQGKYDAFVAKLTASGRSLAYSTYLGGDDMDMANAIAIDSQGNAYVTGETRSASSDSIAQTGTQSQTANHIAFPTRNAYQTYNTIPPNPDNGSVSAANAADSLSNAFVSKINPQGTALVYSTYFGGSGNDIATGIAVDPAGKAYICGYTESPDFPTMSDIGSPREYEAFVSSFSVDGKSLHYTSTIGSDGPDYANAIALDARLVPLNPRVFIGGETYSYDFLQIRNLGGLAATSGSNGVPAGFVAEFYNPTADLRVTLTGTPSAPLRDQEITYTVTVTNLQSEEAIGVKVNFTLPTSGTYLGSSSQMAALSGSTGRLVVANLGALVAGGSSQFLVTWKPIASGLARAQASVTAETYDPVSANNSSTLDLNVGEAPTIETPVVSISQNILDFKAYESGGKGYVTFNRTGETTRSLKVSYSIEGTAVNGKDYKKLSGSVVIPAGSKSARVAIVPINDKIREITEFVSLRINTSSKYQVGSPSSGAVTITDND